MLSIAWPWPYAPEGLPELTIQMNRPDPFDPNDGCGDGHVVVYPEGLIYKVYNLWNRNPVEVSRTYLSSKGKKAHPAQPNLMSF
jgi:3',5'-cyclic-AMP phosphodiesterase